MCPPQCENDAHCRITQACYPISGCGCGFVHALNKSVCYVAVFMPNMQVSGCIQACSIMRLLVTLNFMHWKINLDISTFTIDLVSVCVCERQNEREREQEAMKEGRSQQAEGFWLTSRLLVFLCVRLCVCVCKCEMSPHVCTTRVMSREKVTCTHLLWKRVIIAVECGVWVNRLQICPNFPVFPYPLKPNPNLLGFILIKRDYR